MVDYKKRFVEVDEVLNYLSKIDLAKIPESFRNTIKQNKDPNYIWHYDQTKSLKDQNLSRDTIIILSYINMEFLLSKEQKVLMQKVHDYNEKKKRNQNQNEDILSSKVLNNYTPFNENTKEKLIVKQESENIFISFFNKIKNIFR